MTKTKYKEIACSYCKNKNCTEEIVQKNIEDCVIMVCVNYRTEEKDGYTKE